MSPAASEALDPWTYRARLVRVVDADTVEMELDLGFGVAKKEALRLADLDAPELSTAEGRAVRAIVLDWFDDANGTTWPLLVTTRRTDKYRRYIATIIDATTQRPTLNATLLSLGYAKPWPEERS